MSEGKTVLLEKRGASARLILNRPHERNALTVELLQSFQDALRQVSEDDEARVLIVTGAGESFCAGMSLKMFYDRKDSASGMTEVRDGIMGVMLGLRSLNKPVIAAVNGWCLGGGINVLMSCDLAISSEKAVFGLPEINWGGFPAGGATRAIVDCMLPRHALYLILTGATFDGNEAARLGMVNEAVPHEQLETAVEQLAEKFYRLDPLALSWAKKVALGSMEIPEFGKAVDYENEQMVLYRQGATRERLAPRWKAFMDKKYKPALETFEVSGQQEP